MIGERAQDDISRDLSSKMPHATRARSSVEGERRVPMRPRFRFASEPKCPKLLIYLHIFSFGYFLHSLFVFNNLFSFALSRKL